MERDEFETHRSRSASTRELLADYLRGQHESGRVLFESHYALLLAHARSNAALKKLAPHMSAEDAVGETMLRALSSGLLERFESSGPGSLRNVLLRLLQRVIIDAQRRHGTLKRGGGAALGSGQAGAQTVGALPSPETTPTSAVRANELSELVREHLSEHEWRVWQLFEIEGRDSHEVAAALGVSDAAARGLLHRVRVKLVRLLARHGEESP